MLEQGRVSTKDDVLQLWVTFLELQKNHSAAGLSRGAVRLASGFPGSSVAHGSHRGLGTSVAVLGLGRGVLFVQSYAYSEQQLQEGQTSVDITVMTFLKKLSGQKGSIPGGCPGEAARLTCLWRVQHMQILSMDRVRL